ncbi:MAG: NAD(P)/FAD-dependent oxidoreductase [Clostridia bacterium]|nr:NAD(P)/FAD-dependent oxidoreductase [Clostridia bacterium]
MSRIIVIGGGAAGLLAAGTAAELGAEVTVLEKNKRPGRKLCITGKGRCNITNNCTKDVFIENVNTNPRFLYSAINAFDCSDTMNFFEDLGLRLKTERGNRVFPESDKATDVVGTLERFAADSGVNIKCSTVVQRLIVKDNAVVGVADKTGKEYTCDGVIIATGGCSYPKTGSTGDGYEFARLAGHTIMPAEASLVPLVCDGSHLADCQDMQGLSLRNTGVKLLENNKEIYSDFGELLFTHFGLSGPTILSSSAHLNDIKSKNYTVSIDLKPALDFEKLDARVLRDFDKYKNREISNSLCDLLPSSMIPVVIRRLGVDPALRSNSVTREQRHNLVGLLKDMRFDIVSTRPIDEAIITRGGVKTSEIDPATMESKLCKGLYFCGEVIDVDAYTGGFNLQIAFSTARLAGTWSVYNS